MVPTALQDIKAVTERAGLLRTAKQQPRRLLTVCEAGQVCYGLPVSDCKAGSAHTTQLGLPLLLSDPNSPAASTSKCRLEGSSTRPGSRLWDGRCALTSSSTPAQASTLHAQHVSGCDAVTQGPAAAQHACAAAQTAAIPWAFVETE